MGLERLNITIPDSEKKKKQFNLPQRPERYQKMIMFVELIGILGTPYLIIDSVLKDG